MDCRKCSRVLPADAIFCCYCGIKQEITRKRRKRSNGTGTVFRYRGGWAIEYTEGWEIVGDDLRRKLHRKTGFKTSKDAEDALAQSPRESVAVTVTMHSPSAMGAYLMVGSMVLRLSVVPPTSKVQV